MNSRLEIDTLLHLVDLHRDLAVARHPSPIHSRRVEGRGYVSLPIHRDHAASSLLRHQLLHHDVVCRLLERNSSVTDARTDVGRDIVANEELAIASPRHRTAQI